MKHILLCIGVALVSACATPPRFEYGTYEPSLYAYYKKPEMADKFEASLGKAIEKGEATDRLAPGLYAELGYVRLVQGDLTSAVEMFEKEAASFPEARYFMSSIVEKLTTPDSPEAETAGQEVDIQATDEAGDAGSVQQSAPGA